MLPLEVFGETNGFYWVTESAAYQEARVSDEFRRVRFFAFRLTALFASLAGFIVHAYELPRAAKVAVLFVGIVPALLTAPGMTAITLAASRGQPLEGRRRLLEHLTKSPAYLPVALVRWMVLLTFLPAVWPWAQLFHVRLAFVGLLMVDKGMGVVEAYAYSYALTWGRIFELLGLSMRDYLDALPRYGFLLAGVRGRMRRSIAEAMVYDHLVRLLESPGPAFVPHLDPFAPRPAPLAPDPGGSSAFSPAPEFRSPDDGPPPVYGTVVFVEQAAVPWENAPAVPAEPRPPAPVLAPGELGCPRCATAMRAVVEGVLFCCDRCHGVFADNHLSVKISRGQYPAPGLEARSFFPDADAVPVNTDAPVACPVCAARTRRTYVVGAKVHVDACAEHGTWLDGNEVHALIQSALKDAQDRRDLARLKDVPPLATGSIYRRGFVNMAVAAATSVVETGTAIGKNIVSGDEDERDAAVTDNVDSIIDILTGND